MLRIKTEIIISHLYHYFYLLYHYQLMQGQVTHSFCFGMFVHREQGYGAKETRTPNPQNANLVLYQLSYNPDMGLSGLEPLTLALSERCSNQLSYRPFLD